jgi:hypothetical protein
LTKLASTCRSRKTFGWGSALLALTFASSALGADTAGLTLDEANAQLTQLIDGIKRGPTLGAEAEARKKKALDLLTRAQGELIKGKSTP